MNHKSNKKIEIKNLKKCYQVDGEERVILDHLNLTVEPGEFISIIGHSGCGKSTLLRIIAGLESYQGGEILLGNSVISEPDTNRGMIFQDHRLLPWMTVYDNMAFGYYNLEGKEKEKRIMEHIDLVGLRGYEKAYPNQLSGGMSQRASIARALLHNPQVLLLDEPFGALDALTRIQMQKEMLRIWQEEKTTMILVTHDIDEAIYLSDRIIILGQKPACVETILTCDLGRPRSRTNDDFAHMRQKVYRKFFGEDENYIEYMI